ncbi:hypothetical protein V1514DRAFT_370001 [Lipomyces japonicus]|uniref:uncharacterized protein n=1 Tax=Lipomyces japonicus TaxID=56871 RepID=UPI0034D01636
MDRLESVHREQEAQHEMINGVAATREELTGLRDEVVGLRTHVNTEIAAVRVGFQEFRDRLEERTVEVEETVADLRVHVNEDTGAVDNAVNNLRARINVPPSQDQGAGGRSSLPKIKLPDAFVGDGSDLVDVTTFIQSVRDYLDYHGHPDTVQRTIILFKSCLRGAALEFVNNNLKRPGDWARYPTFDSFIEFFEEAYRGADESHEAPLPQLETDGYCGSLYL